MSLGVPVQMLLCHNADCNMSFPVYHGLVGTVRPFDQLPDPFEARCHAPALRFPCAHVAALALSTSRDNRDHPYTETSAVFRS
jgi:hypothetical protein